MFTLTFAQGMETKWAREFGTLTEAVAALAGQREWVAAAGARFEKETAYDFRAKAAGNLYIAWITEF